MLATRSLESQYGADLGSTPGQPRRPLRPATQVIQPHSRTTERARAAWASLRGVWGSGRGQTRHQGCQSNPGGSDAAPAGCCCPQSSCRVCRSRPALAKRNRPPETRRATGAPSAREGSNAPGLTAACAGRASTRPAAGPGKPGGRGKAAGPPRAERGGGRAGADPGALGTASPKAQGKLPARTPPPPPERAPRRSPAKPGPQLGSMLAAPRVEKPPPRGANGARPSPACAPGRSIPRPPPPPLAPTLRAAPARPRVTPRQPRARPAPQQRLEGAPPSPPVPARAPPTHARARGKPMESSTSSEQPCLRVPARGCGRLRRGVTWLYSSSLAAMVRGAGLCCGAIIRPSPGPARAPGGQGGAGGAGQAGGRERSAADQPASPGQRQRLPGSASSHSAPAAEGAARDRRRRPEASPARPFSPARARQPSAAQPKPKPKPSPARRRATGRFLNGAERRSGDALAPPL